MNRTSMNPPPASSRRYTRTVQVTTLLFSGSIAVLAILNAGGFGCTSPASAPAPSVEKESAPAPAPAPVVLPTRAAPEPAPATASTPTESKPAPATASAPAESKPQPEAVPEGEHAYIGTGKSGLLARPPRREVAKSTAPASTNDKAKGGTP